MAITSKNASAKTDIYLLHQKFCNLMDSPSFLDSPDIQDMYQPEIDNIECRELRAAGARLHTAPLYRQELVEFLLHLNAILKGISRLPIQESGFPLDGDLFSIVISHRTGRS